MLAVCLSPKYITNMLVLIDDLLMGITRNFDQKTKLDEDGKDLTGSNFQLTLDKCNNNNNNNKDSSSSSSSNNNNNLLLKKTRVENETPDLLDASSDESTASSANVSPCPSLREPPTSSCEAKINRDNTSATCATRPQADADDDDDDDDPAKSTGDSLEDYVNLEITSLVDVAEVSGNESDSGVSTISSGDDVTSSVCTTPELIEQFDVMAMKVNYGGRDILDLSGTLQRPWGLQHTHLPLMNLEMFWQNRSQYHRLGNFGKEEYKQLCCIHCEFNYPIPN